MKTVTAWMLHKVAAPDGQADGVPGLDEIDNQTSRRALDLERNGWLAGEDVVGRAMAPASERGDAPTVSQLCVYRLMLAMNRTISMKRKISK